MTTESPIKRRRVGHHTPARALWIVAQPSPPPVSFAVRDQRQRRCSCGGLFRTENTLQHYCSFACATEGPSDAT